MAKTTEPQRRYLESFGVDVPPTRSAARHMLAYILRGTGAGQTPVGENEGHVQERVAILKEAQERWTGKQVTLRSRPDGEVRTVIRVLTKSEEDIQHQMRECRMEREDVIPFKATLSPRSGAKRGRAATFSLGSLMLVEDQ